MSTKRKREEDCRHQNRRWQSPPPRVRVMAEHDGKDIPWSGRVKTGDKRDYERAEPGRKGK